MTMTAFPIESHLLARASSRAFAPEAVDDATLRALFEAARWAASSRNEQPWRFVVAQRTTDPDGYARILSCVNESNRRWAAAAPVLVVSLASTRFSGQDLPNRHALHDLGAASAQLSLEATARGLVVRSMAGFSAERAREALGIPVGIEAVACIAIGHPGDPETLPDELRVREQAPRRRQPQENFVFAGRFGQPFVGAADYERVLWIWLGPLDAEGRAAPSQAQRWYRKDPGYDQALRDELGREHAAVLAGQREAWRATRRGRLGYVILLDQLSRNLFRDTPAMYAGDARAREVASEAIALGDDRGLGIDERCFLYMPFMHSEQCEDQERSVALFTALRDELEGPAREQLDGSLRYAVQHRDIVARFGRFPHRNAILERPSTEEELAFLKEPGSSF